MPGLDSSTVRFRVIKGESVKSVTLYTKTHCSFCEMAKILLKSRNIPYEEIDLSEDLDLRQKISQEHNWRTMPMIFVDGKFIGGYRELSQREEFAGPES